MDQVRWGILSGSKFARQYMAPAIHMARRGRLCAIATSSATKAAPFVALSPGLSVMDSYEELINDAYIDAVYIPLPNHLHVEWAIKALEAGKHVLVEKPLDLTVAGYDKVIAARDKSGKVAAEAFMIVHHPQWQKARELYRSGAIGTLKRVDASFSYDNRKEALNIRNRAETGGGALLDIGVYTFGAARYVSGEEPKQILSAQIEREKGVDVWSHVSAQFPSFHFTGMVSMRMAKWQEVTFHGSKGVLRLTAPFNASVFGEAQVIHTRADLTNTLYRYPEDNQYVHQVEAFNQSVLNGVDFPCPLEFTRGTQVMIDDVFSRVG